MTEEEIDLKKVPSIIMQIAVKAYERLDISNEEFMSIAYYISKYDPTIREVVDKK